MCKTIECPYCLGEVEVNGVGTDNGKFGKVISKVVKRLYFFTCKAFDDAANIHDYHYHLPTMEKEVADDIFYNNCLDRAREQDKWYKRVWLKYQARKFYRAVQIGGQEAFSQAKQECYTAQQEKFGKGTFTLEAE